MSSGNAIDLEWFGLLGEPFAEAAGDYLEAGWNPIPSDPDVGGGKEGIPTGFTGSKGEPVTAGYVSRWLAEGRGSHNVAVRMPHGVVGIDVDQYVKDGRAKRGADHLDELEAEIGPLPATWASTSRPGTRSGIYFYRLPPGVKLQPNPVPDVEAIQRHHRFALVWPSFHPEGRQYRWYEPSGVEAERIPDIDDLADLPWAWIERLNVDTPDGKPAVSYAAVAKFTKAHTSNEHPAKLSRGITSALGNARHGSRHDTLLRVACLAMREAAEGHYPAAEAVGVLKRWWTEAMRDEPQRLRVGTNGRSEFGDVLAWAVGQVPTTTSTPPADVDPATGEIATVPTASAALEPVDPMAGVDGHRYTDDGHARRLLEARHDVIRFVPRWRSWIVYDGSRWRLDHADTLVAHFAAQIGEQLISRVGEVGREDRAVKALLSAVRRAESAAGIAATLTVAASRPGVAIDHEALDADPWLLNVRNGTIDLRTGELHKHDPGDMLMMQADVDLDPDAAAPAWEAFLERILPDGDVRRFVQRLCGLALVGVQIEHVLVICLGGGANGKSTMTRVVADVLGDYSIVASRDVLLALKHDAHPTAKADLFRRRFAHSGELPPAAKLDEAQAKELTGGDRIKARRMREDFWEFDPSHLLWLHANHRPMIEGTDDGIWRRVLLIPFDVQVPPDERDPHLAERIVRTESSGVLRWMLDGLADYQAVGLNTPPAVRAATDRYRSSSDTVALFFAETGIVFDPTETMNSTTLLALHGEWFAASGINDSEGRHYQRVAETLKAKGVTSGRTRSRGRFWRGICEG